ncbi:hypothetical protein J6590_011242 [Homalodisca vitripennis]|nr:hypothetical protein J6590_011242 [Homalodisca vitripennis]
MCDKRRRRCLVYLGLSAESSSLLFTTEPGLSEFADPGCRSGLIEGEFDQTHDKVGLNNVCGSVLATTHVTGWQVNAGEWARTCGEPKVNNMRCVSVFILHGRVFVYCGINNSHNNPSRCQGSAVKPDRRFQPCNSVLPLLG